MLKPIYDSNDTVLNALLAYAPHELALFFDADGTLAHFNKDPGAVRLPDHAVQNIRRLNITTGGALAIVTGRNKEFINDILLPDTPIPSSYGHGAEIRRHFQGAIEASAPKVNEAALDTILSGHPLLEGMRIERKDGARAIHWIECAHPEQEAHDLAQKVVQDVVARYNQTRQPDEYVKAEIGHKVFEIGSALASKGKAVDTFMELFPFKGRTPVFFGDQPADATGMCSAQSYGGFAVGVGEAAPAVANFRVQSPDNIYEILNKLAEHPQWKIAPNRMKLGL